MMTVKNKQSGFTLVEIAIVLVIIGLLLGGILKGQELINSARVRNMADMNSGIQAAYYGFVDRYRAIPGDMTSATATTAIGQTITGGGNANGRVDTAGTDVWQEPNALWEHLSKSGFIQGAYEGSGATEPTLSNNLAPLNVFNGVVIIGRTPDYEGGTANRLNMVLGRNTPVTIVSELDRKIDDGQPHAGVLRMAPGTATVFAGTNSWGATGTDVSCTNTAGTVTTYALDLDAQDCNVVFLY